MTKSDSPQKASDANRLDRPNSSTPCVDRPWDDPAAVERRLKLRRGDSATHRSHHNLYEDMLN
jgi:hypothetical protein